MKIIEEYKDLIISPSATILVALKQMDSIDRKLLLIIKDEKFIGLISIGDIQRSIIQNISLDTSIQHILRETVLVAKPGDTNNQIKQMMQQYRMEMCPVIDENKQVLRIHLWEDLFPDKKPQPHIQFNLPVIIMAGGLGTRLKPLTNVLPKPLIPIGEKTILEEIISRFERYGCKEFYISVNYKAELIEYYINRIKLPVSVTYFKEQKPLGTAGSLSLLKDTISTAFFITNCDILIDQDYSEILDYHRTNKNEITIVAALKHYPIAYGIIETGENGILQNLTEKPELTFQINSGMYILEPDLLQEIPQDTLFHITELIQKLKDSNRKIGVFPVSEGSWKDIGDWGEYLRNFSL